jgi:L-alanine-DL-glutamate epimerase-like enolase superfamily enzyme
MKIISMETHVVAVPPPHVGGMYWIFVTLKTDCGIEGVGEVYAATFHPTVMVPAINDVFERYLFNHDRIRWSASSVSVIPAVSPSARTFHDGHHQRPGNGLLGHHRQGGQSAGLPADWRQGE